MSAAADSSLVRTLTASRLVGATAFIGLLALFIFTTWVSVADYLEARSTLSKSQELLAQLRSRQPGGPNAAGQARQGSPFLEGPSVTVAGASLLQRVSGAITAVGGTIQSSQVDVEGVQAKDGFVGLLISCEVEQPALQKLLYDLEAGMPFLYVDQLDVQMPQAASANEAVSGKVRVVLGVSGQWLKK